MEPGLRENLTLRDYVAPIGARWKLVVALTAALTLAVFAFYARKPDVYKASTKLYTAQESNPIVGTGAGFSDDRTVENQATLLTSTDVAARVARRIGFSGSPAALAGRVTATPSGGSDFISITAKGPSAREAAATANAFAGQFIALRSDRLRAAAAKALAQYREQLDRLPRSSPTRTTVQENIRQLQVATSSGTGNAQQIDPARPPSGPSAPRPLQKALLAFPLALLGSLALAYLLFRLDPRMRSVDDIATVYQRPVLATLGHDPDIACFEDGKPGLSHTSREAFRVLRIGLDLANPEHRPKVIVVTSAEAGEGKSTVVRNLGLAMLEAGRRVTVVDADLRKSALARSLGLKLRRGLTEVLAGEREPRNAVVEVETAAAGMAALERMQQRGSAESNGHATHRLQVLAAGAQPPNPPAVLESPAMASTLAELAADSDVVIVDTAPLLAVSDAIPLIAQADAVLLVARSGIADRRSARRANDTLARVPGANLVGLVVNDLTGADAAGYGAGYYGYGYGDAPEPGPDAVKAPS